MNDPVSLREQLASLSPDQRARLALLLESRSSCRLVGFVQTNSSFAKRDWKAELQERLPTSLIPSAIATVDQFPRLPNGKVDRHALRLPVTPTEPASAPFSGGSLPADEDANESNLNGSELALLSVWQEILGFEEISIDDDFYEIGGDSLLSIQLLSRAKTAGMNLLPSDLVSDVTIRELCRISQERIDARNSVPAAEVRAGEFKAGEFQAGEVRESPVDKEACPELEEGEQWDLVQEIQEGSGAGSVLLMHDIGGDIGYAKHLVKPFTKGCRLFVARQSQSEDAANTIKEMAARYRKEWVRRDAKGPYCLVAYCWGALIAYELARQLREDGAAVEALLVIESKMELAFRFATPAQRLLARSRGVLMSTRDRLGDLARAKSFEEVKKVVPGRIRASLRSSLFGVGENQTDAWHPSERNVNAYYGYEPEPQDLPVHLFRVKRQVQHYGGSMVDESYGWRHLVNDNLKIHYIPGEHESCTYLPHARTLVEQINRVVEQRLSSDS